jgi:hypothetical protein
MAHVDPFEYTVDAPNGMDGAVCGGCGSYRPVVRVLLSGVKIDCCRSCLVRLRTTLKMAFKETETAFLALKRPPRLDD